MSEEKGPLIFIKHILDSIPDINSFTKNIFISQFIKNKEKQNAVVRSIEVIDEAVKNLPSDFKNKHPSIPWIKIVA